MNLRKDHYRSFTRTLCICICFISLLACGSVGEARSLWRHRSSRTLLRQTRLVISLDDALRRRVFVANPLESVSLHASPVSHKYTTLVDGYLGMNNDEERSEMRYEVRIAEFSESSKL